MNDTAKPPKARRGCLFYGCLTGIVCLVAILLAGLLGLHELRRMLDKYTDTKPMPIPTVELPADKLREMKNRVDRFRDDLRAGRRPPTLTLSSDEINALIVQDSDFKDLKGKVYVTIEENRLKAQISLPMQQLGLTRFRGRYLNGSGTFSILLRNGILDVRAEDLQVKGQPVPPTYMNAIRKTNLAAGANENPRASVGMNQLQDLQLKDGQLVITPKDNQ
jgi:hypothetical protein